MKLSEWSKKQGICYKTAWLWFKEGKLPVPAKQTATGTILVEEGSVDTCQAALYARVSSADQKNDLDRQLSRLITYANEKGLSVSKSVIEIGSGMNGHRTKLINLLQDKGIETIVVEHRDRLTRFGFEYIEASLASQGRRIIVVDSEEVKNDLVQDMIEILTSLCARLYGRRSARRKAEKAVQAIENDN